MATKHTHVKKNKINTKLLLACGFCLLSVTAMTVSTYAWFSTSWKATDKIVLTAGESSIEVGILAYTNASSSSVDKDSETAGSVAYIVPNLTEQSSSSALPLSSNVNTDASADSEGVFGVTFDSTKLSAFSFSDLYNDEVSMNEDGFPRLYIELRYTKDSLDGFVKATIMNYAYASDATNYTNISSSLTYQYRYFTVSNLASRTNNYQNGLAAAFSSDYLSTYKATTWTDLDLTNKPSLSLYSNVEPSDDIPESAPVDTSKTLAHQVYVPGYAPAGYYSKSTILEIRVSPLSLLTFYRANPGANANLYNFGLSFNVRLDFSNYPYYEAE